MGSVVITYEERDFLLARELARELEIAGFAVWYRWRDGCVGPSFVGQCERRIAEADAILALVSQPLDPGSWLESDLDTARKHGKRIVLVTSEIAHDAVMLGRLELNDTPETTGLVRLRPAGVRDTLPQLIEVLSGSGVAPYLREELPAELTEKVKRYRLPAVRDVFASIVDGDAPRMMPREAATEYNALPLDNIGDVVVIAVRDPAVVDEIQNRYFPLSHGMEPVLATQESILKAIARVHGQPD